MTLYQMTTAELIESSRSVSLDLDRLGRATVAEMAARLSRAEFDLANAREVDKTYSESARGVMITDERVREMLAEHGFRGRDEFFDCLASMIDHAPDSAANGIYDAGDVLDWLGY